MIRLLFLLAVLVTGAAQGLAAEVRGEIASFVKGKRYRTLLGHEIFANIPTWNEENGPPPVSPDQALVAARKRLQLISAEEKFGIITPFQTRSIGLAPLGNGRWIYVVSFGAIERPQDFLHFHFQIVVLMDGRAADVETEDGKKVGRGPDEIH